MAIRRSRRSPHADPSYRYLVSACLAGIRCSYDGNHKLKKKVRRLVDDGKALSICPEVLGGAKVPRPRCEIRGGDGADVLDGHAKAVTRSGRNVSKTLIRGAGKALSVAKKYGITKAILKSKSPSCGAGRIHDGSFAGRLIKGDGVTAALLRRNGMIVFNEKDKRYAC